MQVSDGKRFKTVIFHDIDPAITGSSLSLHHLRSTNLKDNEILLLIKTIN